MNSLVALGAALLAIAVASPSYAQSDLDARLAAADPEQGKRGFRQCQACHTIDEGAPHRVGPNLWGTVGRAVASADGYPRYSPAMRDFGGAWTPERLDAYLANPRATVPGTRMAFAGVRSDETRADLIAYLNANSPEPMDFTASGSDVSVTSETPEAEEAPDYGLMVVAEGVEETHIYCTACHSEMIVVQQGKSRKHWDDLFEWMVEEQGMSEIPEPERTVILDYLEAHYNVDRPNFPRR